MLYCTYHSLYAKTSNANKSEDNSVNQEKIDLVIDFLKEIKHKEAKKEEHSLAKLIELVNSLKEQLEKMKDKSSAPNVTAKVTPDPYFDKTKELQDRLRALLVEITELPLNRGQVAAREIRLLLPILKDAISPGIADIQVDIHDQIDDLVPLVEGLIEELERWIAVLRVACGTISDHGLISRLSELDGQSPLKKKDFMELWDSVFVWPFATESNEARKVLNIHKASAAKAVDKLESPVPRHVAHAALDVLMQQLVAAPTAHQKLEKQCSRKEDALVGMLNQLNIDIKSQIDSPDTSENVKNKLKMFLNMIERMLDRLVKSLTQFKEWDSSLVRCLSNFIEILREFIATKPDD
jgi:hypothetical protein